MIVLFSCLLALLGACSSQPSSEATAQVPTALAPTNECLRVASERGQALALAQLEDWRSGYDQLTPEYDAALEELAYEVGQTSKQFTAAVLTGTTLSGQLLRYGRQSAEPVAQIARRHCGELGQLRTSQPSEIEPILSAPERTDAQCLDAMTELLPELVEGISTGEDPTFVVVPRVGTADPLWEILLSTAQTFLASARQYGLERAEAELGQLVVSGCIAYAQQLGRQPGPELLGRSPAAPQQPQQSAPEVQDPVGEALAEAADEACGGEAPPEPALSAPPAQLEPVDVSRVILDGLDEAALPGPVTGQLLAELQWQLEQNELRFRQRFCEPGDVEVRITELTGPQYGKVELVAQVTITAPGEPVETYVASGDAAVDPQQILIDARFYGE